MASAEITWANLRDLAAEFTPAVYRKLLSPEECARVTTMPREVPRQHFVAGRILLRELVGARLGRAPADLRIAISAAGRPEGPDHPGLSFSISHSACVVVVALSFDTVLGVDVEEEDRETNLSTIASIAFSANEAGLLAAASVTQRRSAFLRIWTAKEAVAKASGQGFRLEPSRFGLAAGLPAQGGAALAHDAEGGRWWVHSIALESSASCSLASAAERTNIFVRRRWRGRLRS
jgi:4'-phosphopantetheinyl transferase